MRYRFLAPQDLPAIHAVFLAAFADYPFPKRPTRDQLARIMAQRGARFDLSVGAFDDDRMVGVMATGAGAWRGPN